MPSSFAGRTRRRSSIAAEKDSRRVDVYRFKQRYGNPAWELARYTLPSEPLAEITMGRLCVTRGCIRTILQTMRVVNRSIAPASGYRPFRRRSAGESLWLFALAQVRLEAHE